LKRSQQEKKETAAQSFIPYWDFSMIDDEEARDNFLKDVYTFLRKFSRIPFGVTPKVILIAWESFGKIKDVLMDKQYQQEDIQELMSKLLKDVRNISKEFSEYIKCPSWNRPLFYFDDDDDEYTVIWRRPKAITPDLPIKEPFDSLIMEDEHLDTIPATEWDECDVTSPTFTTFSNPLFDSNDDFTSSDDESLSDEDVPMENFKIYLNPLFVDEEIISTKIDPHSLNVESNLIESLLNRDILIDSSRKFDFLFEEFSGELAHINPIPPGIEKADFVLEEEIHLVENLLYDNSSSRPLEELNLEIADTIIESSSPSPIPVTDIDSLMEEIGLFLASDDSMPPGIEDDDYDSEGDIHFLEELLDNDSFPLPEFESFHFDPSFPRPLPEPPDVEISLIFEPSEPVINNIDELNEDECFDPGGIKIDVKLTIPSHLSLGFSFHISLTPRYEYCKNHKKTVKTGQTRTRERKSTQRAGRKLSKVKSGQLKSTFGQLNFTVHRLQGLTTKVKSRGKSQLDTGKANTSDKDYSGRVKTSSNASYWSSPSSEDRG
ncbi:hypothetical protein Tco_1326828, partial [Tanacetum coccineum]